jgi:hypothetical protein
VLSEGKVSLFLALLHGVSGEDPGHGRDIF